MDKDSGYRRETMAREALRFSQYEPGEKRGRIIKVKLVFFVEPEGLILETEVSSWELMATLVNMPEKNVLLRIDEHNKLISWRTI